MEQEANFEGAPLVSMEGVTKRFAGVTAVEDVDFDLRAGEVHALVGENGAGKSTLMKILGGLYRPDEGHLSIQGESVELNSVRDSTDAGVALIPQELELFDELPVAENLFVGRPRPRTKWGAFDWPAMYEEAEQVFSTLGVNLDIRTPVKELSVANRQLVEIGRGLARNAQVLIMDEPTAALSEREASALFDVISGLSSRDVGVIYISHRLEEVFAISHRITVMRDGERVETAPTADLTYEELVRLMVGRPLGELFQRSEAERGEVVLEVRDLTLPGVFENISFSLHKGEVLGLSGLVGAGRTEVAQTIFGINTPSSGEIYIQGERVQPRSPSEAQRAGIAYLPEERRSEGLILSLPISDNITYTKLKDLSRFGLINASAQQEVAQDFVDRLSIRCNSLRDPVSQLSGGNQQKVVLAKSLARDPSILLLDEPTRGVDVGAKSEIYRLIDSLSQSGKAILVISSELPEIMSISDRILVMREGEMMGEFTKEATQEQLTAAAMAVTESSDVSDDDSSNATTVDRGES